MKFIASWFASAVFVLIGLVAGSPDFNYTTKIAISGAAVFGFGAYLTLPWKLAGRSVAAVENWTAMRYSGLQKLPFTAEVHPDTYFSLMQRIEKDEAEWMSKTTWALYGQVVGRARKERWPPSRTYRAKNADDLVKFVAGDVGGPWQCLPGG